MVVMDTATWRVYSSEQSIPLGAEFTDELSLRTYVRDLPLVDWWQDWYENDKCPTLSVEIGGSEHDEWIASHATQSASDSEEWLVSIHPDMMCEAVVLHEIAHCLGPKWDGDIEQSRKRLVRQQVPSIGRRHDHGPAFIATLCSLFATFGSMAGHDDLRSAYEHYEVQPATDAEFKDACLRDAARRQIMEDFHDLVMKIPKTPRRKVETLPNAKVSDDGIPRDWWGDWLFLMRRHNHQGRLISQREIAEAVSRIEPCSRRSISEIERSDQRPDSAKLLRIAMASAVYIGLDPLWMRTAKDLTRWSCFTDLDELEVVNPTWVAQVRHLNSLIEARPPRWEIDGHR